MAASWSQCEVSETAASEGWQRFCVHLMIDDQPCDEVLAIIGMCGAGVAYVDSVELVRLDKENR
jgi:hypothetical protein